MASFSRNNPGYVYVCFNPRTQLHKIGTTSHPDRREWELSKETLSQCRMLHTIWTNSEYRLERYFHKRYREYVIGGEWFKLPVEAVKEIRSASALMYHDSKHLGTRADANAAIARLQPNFVGYVICECEIPRRCDFPPRCPNGNPHAKIRVNRK